MTRPKLKTLAPRVQSLPDRLPGPPKVKRQNYAQGRGGRPWRRLRDQVLERDQHLCQPCKAQGILTQATMVDHIVPQAEGGTDDPKNLQAICADCHQAKTNEERRRGIHRHYG